MKVYIVTSGEYSDYGIDAVCSTMEIAEKTKEMRGSNNDIFGMEVDEMVNMYSDGRTGWQVIMSKTGDVISGPDKAIFDHKCDLRSYPNDNYSVGCYLFNIIAKDPAGAIKIANEKRIEIIAANAWFEGENAWKNFNNFLNDLD